MKPKDVEGAREEGAFRRDHRNDDRGRCGYRGRGCLHPYRRAKLYRELSGRVAAITSTHALDMGPAQRRPLPSFAKQLAVLPDFLPPHTFAALRAEAERLGNPERNYVPTHKKGGTIAYETLIAARSRHRVASITASTCSGWSRASSASGSGRRRSTTRARLSLLFYDKPGDHIGWHFDHNFYRGRHFTLLLAIVNTGPAARWLEPCGAARRASAAGRSGSARPRIRLVVFEGALVHHEVNAITRRRAAHHAEHDLLQRPPRPLVAGGGAAHEGHGVLGVRALWT